MKERTLLDKIISNPIVQTFVIYVSGGWIILEITEYFIENFGLSESTRNILLIILLCIFPFAVLFAWTLHKRQKDIEKESQKEPLPKSTVIPVGRLRKILFSLSKPQILLPGILIILAIVITVISRINHQSKIRWATEVAIPEINHLIDQSNLVDGMTAFTVAKEAEKYIQDDPEFVKLLLKCSWKASIRTKPQGANIYIKNYTEVDKDWELLGVSPIDSIRISKSWHRWKIEKQGYETMYWVARVISDTIHLDKNGTTSKDMLKVPGGNYLDYGYLPDFNIDKYEVTNEKFREFIDKGGYQKKDYWKNTFIKDGQILTWEEAIAQFTDATGRQGPSTWYAGDYPDGQDKYPVSGVSWYEAAAYAEFAGKSLPTIYHWSKAVKLENINVFNWFPSSIIPLSNFLGQGPVPAGSLQGMNAYGAYDMAGNVSEWCWNETIVGRCIRGGSWNSPNYMYHNNSQKPPFDRSPQNGFRCVSYIDEDKIPEIVFEPISIPATRDFYNEKPKSDEVFQIYKEMFSYDKKNLNAIVEYTDSSSEDWIKEKISYDAAYEHDRVTGYLFLPKGHDPPHPTIVYITPSLGPNLSSETQLWGLGQFYFMIKSGYAVMHPVYFGDYERYLEVRNLGPYVYTEYMIKFVKDFKRAIDYLETRSEVDCNKIGSYGLSRGASEHGIIINSVEDRLKMSILCQGGLSYNRKPRPETDAINYVSHVKIPTLMMNGKYDMIFPIQISVKPMFDLLGTRDEDKKMVVTETDHDIPKPDLIRETLGWLDKYFR